MSPIVQGCSLETGEIDEAWWQELEGAVGPETCAIPGGKLCWVGLMSCIFTEQGKLSISVGYSGVFQWDRAGWFLHRLPGLATTTRPPFTWYVVHILEAAFKSTISAMRLY